MTQVHTFIRVVAALAVVATTPTARAQAARVRTAHAAGIIALPAEEPGDSLYRLGRQAVTDANYRRAADLFKQVSDRFPSAKSASDALYWRAWSLHQLGVERHSQRDLEDALASIEKLESEYPKAPAMSDARTLRATIRSAQASLGNADAAGDIAREAKGLTKQAPCNNGSAADQEMRMAALDGLLQMNSEDAMPILKDVLKQRDPCRVEMRKKALFLISQKNGSDVVPTLLDAARNDPSNTVKEEAIFWLSQTRADMAIPALDSILRMSTDRAVQKKAIFAMSQQPRDERARAALERTAEDEKVPEDLREEAVFWLGQSNAADLDFFKTLFHKSASAEMRKKIMFSVSQQSRVQGANAWLLDIARDKSVDVASRKEAIFWLSQSKGIDVNGLQSIYDASKGDREIRKQIIFAYSQSSNAAAVDKLMDIAKNTGEDADMRKEALFWLGQKNDPRVKQFLRDLINR